MSETIYGFNNEDATALKLLIRQNGFTMGGKPRGNPQHCLLAQSGSGIPARTGTVLGTADVAVKYMDSISTAGVEIIDAGYTVKAYNLAASAVGSGKYILLHQVNMLWIVIWEECA